jgi:phosphopantetheinyl transferase (holo-ACP synthase)
MAYCKWFSENESVDKANYILKTSLCQRLWLIKETGSPSSHWERSEATKRLAKTVSTMYCHDEEISTTNLLAITHQAPYVVASVVAR